MNGSWMRRAAVILPWLLIVPVAPCQETPTASRAKLLQDYQDSFDAWRHADAVLESATNPRERLEMLEDAKAKWSAAAAAKSRCFDAIRSLHQNRAGSLSSLVSSSPDSTPVEAAGENTLTDLSTDLNSLDRQIKTESRTLTRAQLTALTNQRRALAAVQEMYRTRQRALKELHQNDTLLEKSRTALAERHLALAAAVAERNENAAAEAAWWSAAYGQMRRVAVQQIEAAAAPAPPPAASPAPAPSKPAPTAASPAPPPTFAGEWTLASPRPEKFSDATGPLYGDVDVQVQIVKTGDRISGTYTGIVFVPPGERYNPGVRFSFSGPAGSGAVIEARIESPLSGIVRLEFVDDRRMRISYRIDRTPASAGISFKIGELKELLRKGGSMP